MPEVPKVNGESRQRRSLRMHERLHLEYEVISEREYEEGCALRNTRLGGIRGLQSTLLDLDTRLAERLYVLRSASSQVAECLGLLNEKIDAVIGHMPEVRQHKATLAARPPELCQLGADGMTFGTAEHLAPGTRVALRFLLVPGHRYIETFATAVREVPPPDPDSGHPYGIAVEFHGLETSQREVIIQHLLTHEAETLRARRREAGAVPPAR